jgi:hypothetical protein
MVMSSVSQLPQPPKPQVSGNDRSMQDEETPRVSHRKTKPEIGLFYTKSSDIAGAAEAVSTGLSSAMNKLSGLASFVTQEEDPIIEKLERQLQAQQKVSYTMAGEEKKEEGFVGDDNAFFMSNSTGGSSPNRSGRSRTTSGEASRVITKSSPTMAGAPMARMRNTCDELASALDADDRTAVPKISKTPEEIRAAKQRKWKKHMKLAKKRRQQERRVLEEEDTPESGLGGRPGFIDKMLGNFLPEPHKLLQLVQVNCGNVEDVSESDDSNSSESSDDVSDSSTAQEESRAAGAPSPARSSKSARRGRSRKPRPGGPLATPRSNSRTSAARSNSRSKYSSNSERSASRVSSSATSEPDPPPKKSRQSMRGAFPTEPFPMESDERLPPSARTDYPMDSLRKKALELNIRPDSIIGSETETVKQSSSSPSYKHQAKTTVSPSAMNVDPNDKSFVKAFIQDIMTQGCPLHWHSEPMSMAPHSIRMYLKPGHRAPNGAQCGPRLVWVDIKKPDNKFGIDLFDIRSLDKAGAMHLQNYPFAIPGRSIFLKLTRERDFVFEAVNEEQALRFIHGMRWVVARLAFNLVIGNLDVSCELLDVGLMDGKKKVRPDTALEESRWTKAMDDVTNQLVDKSVFHHTTISTKLK